MKVYFNFGDLRFCSCQVMAIDRPNWDGKSGLLSIWQLPLL